MNPHNLCNTRLKGASWLIMLSALIACSGERPPAAVVVQLQTDLVAGEEFDEVELSLWSLEAQESPTRVALPISGGSFYPAAKLAQLPDIPPGEYRLSLLLRDNNLGRVVIERPTLLTVDGNLAVSVPVTRSCLHIHCRSDQTCLAGQCVDLRCTLEHPERCSTVQECSSDTDCQPAARCAVGACRQGLCWSLPRAAADGDSCDDVSWCHPESQCQPRSDASTPDPSDPQVAASCSDATQNGNESDIDCGGSCGTCSTGLACGVGTDCDSGVCSSNICQAPSCSDAAQNGSETDVDCGGSCGGCGDGQRCAVAGDCSSLVCTSGICQVPTCSDSVQNGNETGIDCGGNCGSCGGGDGEGGG
ncbi:MAG: hypothetical protein ACPGUV_08815 [Polyangiales bacterium]